MRAITDLTAFLLVWSALAARELASESLDNPKVLYIEMADDLTSSRWTSADVQRILLRGGDIIPFHADAKANETFLSALHICDYIRDDSALLLIVLAHADSIGPVRSLFANTGLPTVAITTRQGSKVAQRRQKDPPSPMFEVNLSLGTSCTTDVVQQLVLLQKWKRVIVLRDTREKFHVADLVTTLSRHDVTLSLFEFDGSSLEEMLEVLVASQRHSTDSYPYVVLASETSMDTLLQQAGDLGLTSRYFWWLFCLSSPPESDSLSVVPGANIAAVTVTRVGQTELYRSTLRRIREVVQGFTEGLYLGHRGESDTTTMTTTITTTSQNDTATLGNYCTSPISDFDRRRITDSLSRSLVSKPKSYAEGQQYSVLSSKVQASGPSRLEEVAIGTTSEVEKQLQASDNLYPNSKHGFNNRTFIVTSLAYSYFQQKHTRPDGTVYWDGLTFTILDELAKDLNFSYVVQEPTDGHWGITDENGTWNGMIADVMHGRRDFAAASFSVTAIRESVIDFTVPYFYSHAAVIIKRPNSNNNKLALYLKPFSVPVWLGVIFSLLLGGTTLWAFTRISPAYDQTYSSSDNFNNTGALKWQNSLLYFYGFCVNQGGDWLPQSCSGRCVLCGFWIFAIVILATYTGNLMASLAVNTVTLPFNTLAELASQDTVRWGAIGGVAYIQLFRDSKVEPYVSIYKGMEQLSGYDEGMERVRQGGFAFIAEESYYKLQLVEDCNLAMLRETFFPNNVGWVFPENSPHLQLFNDRLTRMREAGLLKLWAQQWGPKATNCTHTRAQTTIRVVDMKDIQGAVYALGMGIILSALSLALEMLLRKHKRA